MPVATTVVSGSGAPTTSQVGPADPSGQLISGTPTSPLGFFGTTPSTQPTTGGTNGNLTGLMTIYQTSLSPVAVAANTTAEQTLTVTGLISGQMIVGVIKPTTQAGLAIVGFRASATNTLAITFANDTSGSITPTASESYITIAAPVATAYQPILTPAAVAANTFLEQQFSVPGLPVGAAVSVNKPTAQAGLGIVNARVVSAGILGITFANFTASPITPTAAQTYLVFASPQINPAPIATTLTQTLTPVSVAANTTAEQTFTVPNLLVGSQVVVSKPSNQASLGIGGARVSAANTLAINYINNSAAAIVPPSEVYTISYYPAPAASSTAFNVRLGTNDHAALVALGLVAAP